MKNYSPKLKMDSSDCSERLALASHFDFSFVILHFDPFDFAQGQS